MMIAQERKDKVEGKVSNGMGEEFTLFEMLRFAFMIEVLYFSK